MTVPLYSLAELKFLPEFIQTDELPYWLSRARALMAEHAALGLEKALLFKAEGHRYGVLFEPSMTAYWHTVEELTKRFQNPHAALLLHCQNHPDCLKNLPKFFFITHLPTELFEPLDAKCVLYNLCLSIKESYSLRLQQTTHTESINRYSARLQVYIDESARLKNQIHEQVNALDLSTLPPPPVIPSQGTISVPLNTDLGVDEPTATEDETSSKLVRSFLR